MNREKEMDERFMRMALEEARKAGEEGEVPVGAVLVAGEDVLARAGNGPIALNDPTAHAEIRAIRSAAAQRGNYRLPGTTLYATLEPCIMCAGAVLHARIGRVGFGCRDPRGGAVESLYRILRDERLNHCASWTGGILEGECSEILIGFFRQKRIM